MPKIEVQSTNASPPLPQLLMGLLVLIAGALIMALAVGLIPADEKSFRAPHWVVGAAGLAFMLAGVMILLPLAFSWLAPDDGQLPAQQKTLLLLQQLLGALLLSAFAAIALWVGFGEGERVFSSSVSIGGFTGSGHGGESSGRLVFGGAGILMALWAAYGWFTLLQMLLKTDRDDAAR